VSTSNRRANSALEQFRDIQSFAGYFMNRAKSSRPANSVDRSIFRDMRARFAAAEIEPRWRR
jgi:hypothetical protein